MRWCWAMGVVGLLAVGCQGNPNVPKIDPFAAYGATRIPPPGTGSYGSASGSYYTPGGRVSAQEAPLNAPQFAATDDASVAPAVAVSDDGGWQTGGVRLVSAEQPAPEIRTPSDLRTAPSVSFGAEEPIRVVERVGPAEASRPELAGMKTTDAAAAIAARWSATQLPPPMAPAPPPTAVHVATPPAALSGASVAAASEPARFVAPRGAIEISQLPPAPAGSATPATRPPTVSPDDRSASIRAGAIRPVTATATAGRFIPLDVATARPESVSPASLATTALLPVAPTVAPPPARPAADDWKSVYRSPGTDG